MKEGKVGALGGGSGMTLSSLRRYGEEGCGPERRRGSADRTVR